MGAVDRERAARRGRPMTGTELLPGASPTVAALAVIGVVVLEAVLLYAGYGVVEDRLGPVVFRRIARR
ncbi:hypothetical protein C469_13990 [Halorubrum lipolyticum DSM 21995]|uniref:Uncharacterized protein n=2 Tax=Halorubrum lipolyticum TaxID=368624 RepID=M0NKG1_9EURY|nr:hypothetical protein C469_13990 [Halorubrum lipolyticum DSM 21995]